MTYINTFLLQSSTHTCIICMYRFVPEQKLHLKKKKTPLYLYYMAFTLNFSTFYKNAGHPHENNFTTHRESVTHSLTNTVVNIHFHSNLCLLARSSLFSARPNQPSIKGQIKVSPQSHYQFVASMSQTPRM